MTEKKEKIEQQVQETKEIMQMNVNKLTANMDNLEILKLTTEDLELDSKQFRIHVATLRRDMWRRRIAKGLCIFFPFFIISLIVLLFVLYKTDTI